jgi:hypothetical protein
LDVRPEHQEPAAHDRDAGAGSVALTALRGLGA